jgi:hypothetical protein
MSDKVACQDWRRCGWHGTTDELLRARNPFNAEDVITACPKCKCLESTLLTACDEPGCWEQATCGTPTKAGYRNTCHNHRPEDDT